MKLEFHPDAEMELIEAASYYEARVAGLGERLGREVRRTTALLLEHPEVGSKIEPDLRRFALDRFPYTIIYSVSRDVLYVLAVAHQSRRPGYWRSRTI
jgi:plasmid stabilization system protein ParE